MDIATFIGIITGVFLIVWSIMMNGDIKAFIDVPSIMIVFGGTLAATMVKYTMKDVLSVMGVVRNAFRSKSSAQSEIVAKFVELAKVTRKDGILAVDRELSKIQDQFMRDGLMMAVDGNEPDTIRNIMETELNYLQTRHRKGAAIFSAMGEFSPAFGMLGTLIGLINMLRSLDDPSNIGAGMAVALVTTFYGSVLANLVFLPLSGKLKNKSEEEVVEKELIIEGVLAIQQGEHPRNINRRLLNFVPPKQRNNNQKESDTVTK
jgi:chemotaxis protein MotA